MPWIKIDDRFPSHPKSVAAGPYGRDLFVGGLCYCNTHLTDGFIPEQAVSSLSPGLPNAFRIAERLVHVGLWEQAEGGYQVHDYAEYQPARDQIKAQRAASRERLQRWREKQTGNGVSPALHNGARNGVGNANPDPTRPKNLKPTPLRDEVARLDLEFEGFYAMYPRKVAPDHARPAWRKARKKASREEIMAALEAQLRELRSRPTDKIPYPASWLNGGHWRNEAQATLATQDDAAWPHLFDCAQCGEAHETRGCPSAGATA